MKTPFDADGLRHFVEATQIDGIQQHHLDAIEALFEQHQVNFLDDLPFEALQKVKEMYSQYDWDEDSKTYTWVPLSSERPSHH